MDTEDGLQRVWKTYFRANQICRYEAHPLPALSRGCKPGSTYQPRRFVDISGREDVPFLACLRPCLSIQKGAYITTTLVVTPPAGSFWHYGPADRRVVTLEKRRAAHEILSRTPSKVTSSPRKACPEHLGGRESPVGARRRLAPTTQGRLCTRVTSAVTFVTMGGPLGPWTLRMAQTGFRRRTQAEPDLQLQSKPTSRIIVRVTSAVSRLIVKRVVIAKPQAVDRQ